MRILTLCNSDKVAVVDDADSESLTGIKWYLSPAGYAVTNRHRKGATRRCKDRNENRQLHRMLMGDPPIHGLQVDHIDRDRLNNRRSNLRWVTHTQNVHNSGPRKGFKGVTKDGTRWVATIRQLHLGSFVSAQEAAQVYDKAARHFYGKYAMLNIPDVYYQEDVRYVDYYPDSKKPTSKYTGVSYFGHGGKRIKRWRAVYRKKTIGYFGTEVEAARAYSESKESHQNRVS